MLEGAKGSQKGAAHPGAVPDPLLTEKSWAMLGFRVQGLLGLRSSRAQSFRDLGCEFRSEGSEGRVAAASVQERV